MAEQAYKNTNKEIWRGRSHAEFGDDDRFYADSLGGQFLQELHDDFTLHEINNGALHAGIASRHWNALEKQLAGELLKYIEGATAAAPEFSEEQIDEMRELTRIIINTNWKRTGQCDNRHIAMTNGQWQAITSRALKLNAALLRASQAGSKAGQ